MSADHAGPGDRATGSGEGMPLRELYQEMIMDHARKPHGFGLTDPSSAESHQVNPTCGDEVTLRIRVDATGTRVEGVSWEGHGCAISQASASLLFDTIRDLDREAVNARIDAFRTMMQSRGAIEGDEALLGDAVVLAGAARYVARIKCAMLPWVALEDALTRA